MSRFVGIDYDSHEIHAVAIDEQHGHLVEFLHADLGAGDAFDRSRRVRDNMPARGRWRDNGVLAIGIELPYTQQKNSLVAQIRVQGAILACLPADLMVLDLRPQRWKLRVLGPGGGNATKEQAAAWAHAHGCPDGIGQDFVDAFCIAHATRIEWNAATAARQKGAA